MATFRVGQRVRKVREPLDGTNVAPLGAEGTIVEDLDWEGDYTVKYDCMSRVIWAEPQQLEPIQPEYNQIIAWSECLWQPEHMREATT